MDENNSSVKKVTREKVAGYYSEAVTGQKRGAVQATGKAKFAGYNDATLNMLPEVLAKHLLVVAILSALLQSNREKPFSILVVVQALIY